MKKYINNGLVKPTHSRYLVAFLVFQTWVQSYDPAWDVMDSSRNQGVMLAYYMTHLLTESADKNIGSSRVEKAHAALTFYYKQGNWKGSLPTMDPLCLIMLQSARKSLTAKKLSREPLTALDIRLLLITYLGPDGQRSCDLRIRMHVTVILLSFVGLLRYSDLCQVMVDKTLLRFVTLPNGSSGMLIFLATSKTDKLWRGQWVAIGATGKTFCPVKLVRNLLKIGGYCTSHISEDCGPLLRAVTTPSPSHHCGSTLTAVTSPADNPIAPLSYTTYNSSFKALFSSLNIQKAMSTHSCRSGGTSAYLSRSFGGVISHNQLVAKLGRWKFSNTMESTYWKPFEVDIQRFFQLTRTAWPY